VTGGPFESFRQKLEVCDQQLLHQVIKLANKLKQIAVFSNWSCCSQDMVANLAGNGNGVPNEQPFKINVNVLQFL
jgi:hypothetical protein